MRLGMEVFKDGDQALWEGELLEGLGRISALEKEWTDKEKAVAQSSMAEGDVDLF